MLGSISIRARIVNDVLHVTFLWTDVKERSVRGEDIVDFAGVYDTYVLVSHYDNVQVASGQRCRQPFYRLVRNAQHIPHLAVSRMRLHLPEFASPTDKTKRDLLAIRQALGRLK